MRTKLVAAFIVICLSLLWGQASAQHYAEQPQYELSYLIFDGGAYTPAGFESESAVNQMDIEDSGVPEVAEDTAAGSHPETPADESVARPVLSGNLTREGDSATDQAGEVSTPPQDQDPCDSGLAGVLGKVRQVEVAEEACYVKVMSEGLASIREVRSLDLCPGRSSLRLANIPTSIVEDSVFLSVWSSDSEVSIRSYRLVRLEESAELLVEIMSAERVVGASLEVNYLTTDLDASLSYSGLFDSDIGSLRLAEWLTVTNGCGKSFDEAVFSFRLADLGFEHRIPSSVTLSAGEESRFLCNIHLLSSAHTIVTAENNPDTDEYEITELIKVEDLKDQDLLIPSSPVTIYSMSADGFISLKADGHIHKPREYSWFTVETLDKPDVHVQRAKTGDEVTGTGGIRDVSYMVNIDNRSSEEAVVTIYERMGPGNWIVVSATVDAKPISHSRDLSRREYATFTVQVPPNSSRALFYKARIPER